MKTNRSDVNQKMIVSELLSYLAEHPQAQDTLEGIANWWLLEQEVARRTSEVEAALDGLVNDGFLLEIKGEDNRSRYRINWEKQHEIESYLNRKSESDE